MPDASACQISTIASGTGIAVPVENAPASTTARAAGRDEFVSGRRERPIVKNGPTVCDGVGARRQWSSSGVATRPPSTMSNR